MGKRTKTAGGSQKLFGKAKKVRLPKNDMQMAFKALRQNVDDLSYSAVEMRDDLESEVVDQIIQPFLEEHLGAEIAESFCEKYGLEVAFHLFMREDANGFSAFAKASKASLGTRTTASNSPSPTVGVPIQ